MLARHWEPDEIGNFLDLVAALRCSPPQPRELCAPIGMSDGLDSSTIVQENAGF
jgi:hypothetical protein